MIRILLAATNAILSACVLIPTAIITHTYIVRPRQVEGIGDWIQVLLPLIPPLVALYLCLLLWQVQRRGPIARGLTAGAFVASVGYMALQAHGLFTQYTLISEDGVAHWAMLQLPVIWIAIPALLIGLIVGAIAGLIRKKKAEQGVAPYVAQSAPSGER